MHHINERLADASGARDYLPLSPNKNDFFTCMPDGVVLSKLLNNSVPNTIDERVIILHPGDDSARSQNLSLFINSAKGVGANMLTVDVESLLHADAPPIFSAVWESIKVSRSTQALFFKISPST